MRILAIAFVFCLFAAILALPAGLHAQALVQTPAKATRPPSYDTLISASRKALGDGKVKDALVAAMAAAAIDDKRFEAYALGAAIKMRQGDFRLAGDFLREAHRRAPTDKQVALADLDQLLKKEEAKVAQTKAAVAAGNIPSEKKEQSNEINQASGQAQVTPRPTKEGESSLESRRRLEILKLILEDIDKAKSAEQRSKFLQEFMAQSESFLKENPANQTVWMLRAIAALELNRAKEGWEAGHKLIALDADNSKNPKLQAVMARLERKDWLTESEPSNTVESTIPKFGLETIGNGTNLSKPQTETSFQTRNTPPRSAQAEPRQPMADGTGLRTADDHVLLRQVSQFLLGSWSPHKVKGENGLGIYSSSSTKGELQISTNAVGGVAISGSFEIKYKNGSYPQKLVVNITSSGNPRRCNHFPNDWLIDLTGTFTYEDPIDLTPDLSKQTTMIRRNWAILRIVQANAVEKTPHIEFDMPPADSFSEFCCEDKRNDHFSASFIVRSESDGGWHVKFDRLKQNNRN